MKRKGSRLTALALLIVAVGTITGCAPSRSMHHASSVVQYLYPNTAEPVETPVVPTLSLPLRVGIAFVPEGGAKDQYRIANTMLGEKAKLALMEEIGNQFKKYPFVRSIELIPSAYLSPGGSFTNLDQIRTMLGVDVIALLSYDQVQFTDQGVLSLAYWTLVGAYVIKGERNDTNTMMDTAVYHIPSRKMLFRAPGLSQVRGSSTPVNLSEQLRNDRQAGFQKAADMMVVNLQEQLERFKEKVKSSPAEFKVVHQPGYTGGGSLDGTAALLLIALGGYRVWLRRHRGQ